MPVNLDKRDVLPEEKNKSPTIPERVALIYYTHGLFCSSYPVTIISFAIAISLLCCYPLLNLPLPGNLPQQISWPKNDSVLNGTQQNIPYTWAKTQTSFCYVQHVLVRSAVLPWSEDLILTDAFRSPLYEVFKILEIVRNHQDPKSSKTLGHLCLHVENVKRIHNKKEMMPEYSCLTLSPANLWQNNAQQFSTDTNLLGTIYNHQNYQKGKTSLAEVLFGLNLKDAGLKRYPIRNRLRIIQYAVTIILQDYDESFIDTLKEKLITAYPLHQDIFMNQTDRTNNEDNEVIFIYYSGNFNYYEFVPLIVAFVLMFVYTYFSLRKIEIIKSKIGMAIAALTMIALCLLMSVGLCFFFGLTLSLQGKEIFPYLVILVGLENVLVLTKSVVSTPQHLDVKIRIAQGLSKEGWSITKNIFIELTILTIGFFTFIPAIQEFCIFAIVGLISDFFLQMLFFSTVLSIDIRRTEHSQVQNFRQTTFQNSFNKGVYDSSATRTGMNRSKSHPRLSSLHTNVVALQTQNMVEKKIPKRLRLVHIWARTRFFQRGFMIWMIVWISMFVYDTGVIEQLIDLTLNKSANQNSNMSDYDNKIPYNVPSTTDNFLASKLLLSMSKDNNSDAYITSPSFQNYVEMKVPFDENRTNDLIKLKHSEFSPLKKVSRLHWPTVFQYYNISVAGNYITVLPAIKISHVVSSQHALSMRNPDEKPQKNFQWSALAAALDPLDFSDTESINNKVQPDMTPFYPSSPMEIMLTTILCIISTLVLAYATSVLYRCICSRNYAEWRASWAEDEHSEQPTTQLVMEAVPITLEGHTQQIECIASDGSRIVSSCLAGLLKIWDLQTAEPLCTINRKIFFGYNSHAHSPDQTGQENEESFFSDYESGSPPSRDESTQPKYTLPTLNYKINTNFSNLKSDIGNHIVTRNNLGKPFFDFSNSYKQMFHNEDVDNEENKKRRIETANWVYENNTQPSVTNRQHNCSKARSIEKIDDCDCDNNCAVPAIWCLDYVDNLIALGCANGRLEFWEGTTGNFKCLFEDGSGLGITSVKIIANRVVAAKLNGALDFILLESYTQGRQIDWGFTSAYRRTHMRTGSAGSLGEYSDANRRSSTEDLRCVKLSTTRAHQQPITVLDSEGGRVVSGSQDHTLKVFRLEDQTALYTLHGHCGPITSLFIDRISPMMSGSGSQDGLLCVWDLLTGTCMYSIQAHDGAIVSLTYSASYVISLGADERLCVWERFQGHLLNTMHVKHTYATSMAMLSQCLLVCSRGGGLAMWDVRTGERLRRVPLGHRDSRIHVRQLLAAPPDAVICDYGSQLRIVRFPLVHDKFE